MWYPLKFVPAYKDYLWGGRYLESLGRSLPSGIVAESWEISAHPDGVSVIANGPLAGILLPEYLVTAGEDLLGHALNPAFLDKFPLLIKLIDAHQQLSVQVHPNDSYARLHEDEIYGKTEMWYIIAAKPNAKIVYGLRSGVTKDIFKAAIALGEVEGYLNYLEVAAGDVVLIPAGTVHALGSGIVLAEVQQNSNATYRVYDYNRVDVRGERRPLHVDKALEVIDFQGYNSSCISHPRLESSQPGLATVMLANTPYFTVELYRVNGDCAEKADGSRFCVYTFIEGHASVRSSAGVIPVNPPESILIPAALGEYALEGIFKALKIYIS